MWSTLGELAVSSPWLLTVPLACFGLFVLLSLALCLRGTQAAERAEIIRALADVWRFRRRR